MKMELIQPFINAADAVLAQALQEPTTIGAVSMEEEAYRRKGIAAIKPYLIDFNINADQNPGGAGVWELPGLGVSKVAIGGRYQPT